MLHRLWSVLHTWDMTWRSKMERHASQTKSSNLIKPHPCSLSAILFFMTVRTGIRWFVCLFIDWLIYLFIDLVLLFIYLRTFLFVFWLIDWFIYLLIYYHFCCAATVASEQQHKQDLRRIYKREYEFSKSSLFTRVLCGFLPECIAPFYQSALWHRFAVLFLCGLRLRQVSGYGLLWFTCKAMWARSCLAFTTLTVVVNAEFESLEIWTINCDVLI